MASGGERQRRLIRGEPKTLSTLSPFRPGYPTEPVLKHGIRPPRGKATTEHRLDRAYDSSPSLIASLIVIVRPLPGRSRRRSVRSLR